MIPFPDDVSEIHSWIEAAGSRADIYFGKEHRTYAELAKHPRFPRLEKILTPVRRTIALSRRVNLLLAPARLSFDYAKACKSFVEAVDFLNDFNRVRAEEKFNETLTAIDEAGDVLNSFQPLLFAEYLFELSSNTADSLFKRLTEGGEDVLELITKHTQTFDTKSSELEETMKRLGQFVNDTTTVFKDQATRNKRIRCVSIVVLVTLTLVIGGLFAAFYIDTLNNAMNWTLPFAIAFTVQKTIIAATVFSIMFAVFRILKSAMHNIEINDHRIALLKILKTMLTTLDEVPKALMLEKFITQIVINRGFDQESEKQVSIDFERLLNSFVASKHGAG